MSKTIRVFHTLPFHMYLALVGALCDFCARARYTLHVVLESNTLRLLDYLLTLLSTTTTTTTRAVSTTLLCAQSTTLPKVIASFRLVVVMFSL